MSFQKRGILESKEESDKTYRNIVIGMQLATLATMPVFGYYSDRVDLRIFIPLAFLSRGLVCISFRLVEHPQTVLAFFLAICLTMTSAIQFLAVEVLFMRNMKSTIRGTLNGIAFFFGGVGTTIFVLIGGILFDKVAPWAPFMVVGVADFVAIIFSAIFFLSGIVKRDD
uniref:Major facilitator superfamily (MFS) profile domain-containing protein n=1 Tax=Favella ehrenbergii TaxID=182087 RepID=A0A7S3MI32_9SPIT|mmetsp:Transcript_1021/g.1582  ORF Transcript_1021/g.1582 Transcript_1021/m.1582 type:complete len:169 (+) Transcript_1021:266-772(+)